MKNSVKPYIRKIHYHETDKMGITHHANYIKIMEEARVDFLDQIGWSYKNLEESGMFSPTISLTCNYKKSTTFNDEVEVEVKVISLSPAKLSIGYEMRAGGEIVFTAESSHCFLNEAGRPIALKRINPDFYSVLEKLINNAQ